MEENKTFELVPLLDDKNGKYVVKDFDINKKIVEDFIEREVKSITSINGDYELAQAKSTRTYIRKNKDAIQQARLQMNALLLGTFNEQLKEIESLLDTADKEIKVLVDTYNTEVKGKIDNKPRVITLSVKGYDASAIEKVKELALKLGLSAEVK